MDALYWYYVQSKKTKDIVGSILKQIVDSGHKRKSRIAVIQQLLQQDIISLAEYDDLMQFEDSQFETEAIASPSGDSRSKEESGIDISDNSDISAFNQQPDDIKVPRKMFAKCQTTAKWTQCITGLTISFVERE